MSQDLGFSYIHSAAFLHDEILCETLESWVRRNTILGQSPLGNLNSSHSTQREVELTTPLWQPEASRTHPSIQSFLARDLRELPDISKPPAVIAVGNPAVKTSYFTPAMQYGHGQNDF